MGFPLEMDFWGIVGYQPFQTLFVAVRRMRRAGITPAPINRFSPALKNLFRSSETIARGTPLIVAV